MNGAAAMVKDGRQKSSPSPFCPPLYKQTEPGNTCYYKSLPDLEAGMSTKTSPLSIKLDEQEKQRLKSLGLARKRSPHWLARQAIAEYLEREEAVERFKQESIAAWNDYQQGGQAVTHEKVMEWLGTWDSGRDGEAP
jgi:predicted transcriptional regulator